MATKRLSLEQRLTAGKKLRRSISRSDQGDWRASKGRTQAVKTMLHHDRGRVETLLPIKYTRMAASPFGFFRGAAAVMARDMAGLPRSGLNVQLCGDAHVLNLGAFASPEGHLVFDINDFDETMPGPWEWDIKRLASSFVVAGRQAGCSDKRCLDAVAVLVSTYRNSLMRFAAMPFLDLVRHEIRRVAAASPVRTILQKAVRETPAKNLQKLTVPSRGGRRRIATRRPVLWHLDDSSAKPVLDSLEMYRESLGPERQLLFDAYHPVDVGMKVVGTGSVGLRDYIVLMTGIGAGDPLFVQVKEEPRSCYARYLPRMRFGNQGRRVATGQHRMQTVTDPLLGWTRIGHADYLVRQLADHKAGIDPADLGGTILADYAAVCGELFARAHARTGDAAALAGYCGRADTLDRALGRFAIAYADQTTADYELFIKQVKAGRIKTLGM
ncbi:MAG TPA: DUF2252 domain-containing protein [Thermoanaerobaculia bacterium]|nr:DUF2252 domain-containing protein [Thermoanaerobaculia bacterium]